MPLTNVQVVAFLVLVSVIALVLVLVLAFAFALAFVSPVDLLLPFLPLPPSLTAPTCIGIGIDPWKSPGVA